MAKLNAPSFEGADSGGLYPALRPEGPYAGLFALMPIRACLSPRFGGDVKPTENPKILFLIFSLHTFFAREVGSYKKTLDPFLKDLFIL